MVLPVMSPSHPPDVVETLRSDHVPPPAVVLDAIAAPSRPMPLPLSSDHVTPPALVLDALAAPMPLYPYIPEPMEPEHSHDTEIHPPPINMDSFCTPKKRATSGPFCGSSCTPECDVDLKPAVGMTFESMEAVEEFYKAYAHNVGFSVRIGQKKSR
ncbi:hypothetical protein ACQ4PT_039099 [Festuca glaucescens]